MPQFSGPLYAWYNLGLVPPSSTQVAGDRFNQSIQFFCQRGRRGGGSGYSAVILVRTLIPWNSSLNSKYDPPPRNNWINICSRYTKENPIKRIREFFQNIPSPKKVQKNLAIKMLDKIWDGTKCLKRRLWGWFAEAWRGPAWSSRLAGQLMAARPFVCVPSQSTSSQNLKSCSSQYDFERKKSVKYLRRSFCIQPSGPQFWVSFFF